MSSNSSPRVIIYRYETSPYSHKVEHILLLKNVPFSAVEVNIMPPRPEISNLGIDYRRIPVLAIDNDVYCDTGLIASVLERRFPASNGYGTIYPVRAGDGNAKADTGALNAFAEYYAEHVIFPLAATVKVPWSKMPADFIKDRSEFFGGTIDPVTNAARTPALKASLTVHLNILENQLSDKREWLFDTITPSVADVSVFFIFDWLNQGKHNKDLFDKSRFPHTIQWLDHMSRYLQEKRDAGWAPRTKISKEAAASIINSSPFQSYDVVGFDQDHAAKLGLELGCTVSIAPTDTGKANATVGKLVALALDEIVLEVQGRDTSSPTLVRCHFPRTQYRIKKVKAAPSSLKAHL